jgi:hypothetical protein
MAYVCFAMAYEDDFTSDDEEQPASTALCPINHSSPLLCDDSRGGYAETLPENIAMGRDLKHEVSLW